MTMTLPSGAFPIEIHFDVIRRFMSLSRNGTEPVEPAAVEQLGLPSGAARSNAEFLAGLGLLVEEKAGRYKPTGLAMQFINTQLADEGRGRRLLRSVVEKSWFGKTAMTYLQTEGRREYREGELVARLAETAQASAGDSAGALGVLVQYLAYTGIVPPPGRSIDRTGGATDHSGTGSPPAPSRAEAAATAGSPAHLPGPPADRGPVDGPWETIETSEFYLKIRSKQGAVKRLRKQLDLLEQKLDETPGA